MLRNALILLAVLVVVAVIVYWPSKEDTGPQIPPLTMEQAKALPDDQLVPSVVSDISRRIFGTTYDPAAWKALPDQPRTVWVATVIEDQLAMNGFLRFLMERQAGGEAPGLNDAKTAYQALNANGLATILGEADKMAEGKGKEAVAAWTEFFSKPPEKGQKPPADPFAPLDQKFRSELQKANSMKLRAEYIKKNLEAMLAPAAAAAK